MTAPDPHSAANPSAGTTVLAGYPGSPAGAEAASSGAPVSRIRPNVRLLALLSVGHMVVDINQGALPGILPFLREAFALSYAATGAIVLLANAASSVIQPLFGYFSDQTARRWLLPLSVFVSGVGLALTGVAPSYAAILALVTITGFGVAAYHPEGYRTASRMAGARKATGLSFFSIGGNVGIALGPPVITALVTGFGLPGSLGVLLPSLAVALLLTLSLPRSPCRCRFGRRRPGPTAEGQWLGP